VEKTMNIHNAKSISPVTSEHGEIIYELFGSSAGGSQAHSLARIVIPPGKASLKHYHPAAEESYSILSGSARMDMDGESARLGPGDSVVVVPPQVHQIFNVGDDDLVMLVVCAPAWTPDISVFVD
jgi:mannose-6-phosphate isomerase-like protein (cupin superfamily)